MSRIGRKPIPVPAGVDFKLDGNVVTVKGPKGTLTQKVHPNMHIALENGEIHVTRPDDEKENRALHGLTRTLVVNGVGYRVQKQGKELVMTLGFSHLVKVSEIPGITIDVPTPNKIVISGPDKQLVGQFAAEVREKRPPEPYKGKGIKYTTEVVRRKEGKTGGKGKK